MNFEPLTDRLITLIKEGETFKKGGIGLSDWSSFSDANEQISFVIKFKMWISSVVLTLRNNGLELSALKIENFSSNLNQTFLPINGDFKNTVLQTSKIIQELLTVCEGIEKKKSLKEIEIITIDDIDNFKKLLKKVDGRTIDKKYFESAFLEDDVENAFLEVLNEPYKEQDSGAETRDLFTNNVSINRKRIQTAIMFKGRGVRKTLQISDCGKNGNQLLKLAKNTTAQLYIVQHVNKIESDVIEALKDHLFSNSHAKKILICPIDGKDTARLLKALGKDLELLKTKKHIAKKK
jgi:hypothetical protein